MSSIIDRETFQRLTLMYLIAQFSDGVDSDRRLQKLLYLSTRDVELHPFTFHLTRHGPFSRDAAVQLLHMYEADIIRRLTPNGSTLDAAWMAHDTETCREFCEAFEEGLPQYADAIQAGVVAYGGLTPGRLDELLDSDPRLQGLRCGRVLLREHNKHFIRVALDDDLAEELDMMLSPIFLQSMRRLDKAMAEGKFDISKVRVIRSLDEAF